MEKNINLQDILAKFKEQAQKTELTKKVHQPLTKEQREQLLARFHNLIEKARTARKNNINNEQL